MPIRTTLGLTDGRIAKVCACLFYHLVHLITEVLQSTTITRAVWSIFDNPEPLAKYFNSFLCHSYCFILQILIQVV